MYCPQCGTAEFTKAGDKEWRCGECGFRYFHNIAAGVAALLICQGEVLMTRRGQAPALNMLDLPGGFVDAGEGLEQALTREMQEELGLHLSQWRYLGSWANDYCFAEVDYQVCDSFFVADLAERPELRVDQVELNGVEWVRLDGLGLQEVGFGSVRSALQAYLLSRDA